MNEKLNFSARIVAELDALLGISPLALAAWLAFVLALSGAFAWFGPAMIRFAWRVGADPRRRLGLAASGMRVLGLLIAFLGVLRPVFMRAPDLGIVLVLILLGLAAGIVPTQLRNLASGLSLSTRSRLREGDLVTVGEHEGIVRDIRLLRVDIRTAAGGVTHVPASDFDRLPVTVGSRRAASPVEVRTVAHQSFDEDALEDLRRALWLCVYRRAGTELVLSFEPQTRELDVRMDTWATGALAEVERHLRGILLARAGTKGTAPSQRRSA